jgi:hypothetical protein
MKKISAIPSLLFSTICALCLMTCVVRADINNSLVALYDFNGNADDLTGNGFNGTVAGAVLTTDRFGVPDSAYYFAGSGQNISVTPSPDLYSTGTWSATVWFSFQAGGLYSPRILSNGTVDLGLTTTSGSPNVFAAGWNYYGYASPQTLTTDTWYNLAAVCDGTYISMYLDGVYIGTDSHAGGPPSAGSGKLGFGRNLDTGTDWYSGNIDDIRLYNRAISAAEVSEIYNVPEPSTYALLLLSGAASLWALKRRNS